MLNGGAKLIDAALYSGAISGAVSIGLATESAMAGNKGYTIFNMSGRSGGCP